MSSELSRIAAARGLPHGTGLPDQFLETNGRGGYASACVDGLRLWSSHGLLVIAKHPPIDRYVLINGFDVWADVDGESIPLSANLFEDGSVRPDGRARVLEFDARLWPSWAFDLGHQRVLRFEIVARHGAAQFSFTWHLEKSDVPIRLRVRPLLSGRPMQATRTKSEKMSLLPDRPTPRHFVWPLRAGAPPLSLLTDGEYSEDPRWIKGLRYENRSIEDLASPCEFHWDLPPRGNAHILAGAADEMRASPRSTNEVAFLASKLRTAERTRRRLFRTVLDRAADQFIVEGHDGKTLLSGFPRGTEMGEQTMIALRGICLSPGRLDLASEVLGTWSRRLASGMLPEQITEHRLQSTFTSSAPSLWFIIAVYEYIRAAYRQGRLLRQEERDTLLGCVDGILRAFHDRKNGAAFMDEDGLLAEAASPRGRTVKRVHVQALWIAALRIGDRLNGGWQSTYELVRREFDRAFWHEEAGYLHRRLIETTNQPLERDSVLDMQQVVAVGGLPIACVDEGRASLIVQALEERFATPDKIRTAPSLPWHFGPFIEAWFRVRFREPDVLEEVKRRFIEPWEAQIRSGGLNHLARHLPADTPDRDAVEIRETPFGCAETAELLRVLHLPDLQRNQSPFDDSMLSPLFYD